MGVSRLLKRQTVYGPTAWMGSLVQDAQDASGLMYRRNRYYDPQTGKFTQENPAGLAGGINAYGFANGDPVGYSDPYGLKGSKDEKMGKKKDAGYGGVTPRRAHAVYLIKGVPGREPPASCDCDTYSRVEYEPLTLDQAVELTRTSSYVDILKGAVISLVLSELKVPGKLATLIGVGVSVSDAQGYSPQVGDQITDITTVKFDANGERESVTQTTVIKRADGRVIRL